MNNTTKTMQELVQEAFIAKLSDIVEYKNPNEIWWKNEWGHKITIEFVDNSVSSSVVRRYYENGNNWYEREYQNGQLHGKATWWYENGNKDCEKEYQNGNLINKQRY
jgi:antitoxin component YwqK of YwqJK toxin-antitoxin module